MATNEQIQTVAKHFVIAAIWADCEEGTNPRPNSKTHRVAFGICKAFIEANLELFNAAMLRADEGYGSHPDAGSAEAAFGHDLWLTSQGHGVGFWDRKELDAHDLGQKLTDALATFQKAINISCEQYRGWFYVRAWDCVNMQNLFDVPAPIEAKPVYDIEVTDTFGGEANYCWVKRGTTTAQSRRGQIEAAKLLAGWNGWCRVRVEDYGDSLTIRPTNSSGVNQIAFVTFKG